ncbi:TonB-dependent receptor domain-containing protein [Ohtaekwangia kribbensis]|uniref:TonB-dependent receptor domain-containing protein n=1 Tax=Ohtaekwangia kribbensis TaxID=688913 RepID=A0ABW3JUQ6_9BACT
MAFSTKCTECTSIAIRWQQHAALFRTHVKFRMFIFSILAILSCQLSVAQSSRLVSGIVKDTAGVPLPGVAVAFKSKQAGTYTDSDGKFSMQVRKTTTHLSFSFIGFATIETAIPESGSMTIVMEEAAGQLDEVVIAVGSRAAQRTVTDSPLPIDNISVKELLGTGQLTFDKALQYRVPSFNTVQTPVNDATSLLDPYEIRNMGPSRTLVLINGKRKNASALIYTQTSPGRGESGADISAIPIDAIKRVEVLRDGASAQYGSDAIAGVMNVVLKDNTDGGSFTFRTGITSKGDGKMIGLSLNNGINISGKGYINYTIDLSKVGLANRPGTVDAEGEASDFGADINQVKTFLAVKPDAGNINGSPATAASKFLVNGGFDINEHAELYFNAAYIYKKVNSFANYRTPYWRPTDYGLLTPAGEQYAGYLPTFDGDLNDYNSTVGFRTNKNGWNTDVSFTTGGNKQLYTVSNSVNRNTAGLTDSQGNVLYREKSPIIFRAGGYSFSHYVGNVDISRTVAEKVHIAFGSEFRSENFEIIEGDRASYEGGGADSFAGNSAENSFKSDRYNFGGYVDVGVDLTENFLVNAAGRYEDYSDFGDAFVYKFSSRYKLLDDKITLRGSISTGFRAPSLHQINVQKTQYGFVPGQGIQVSGLVNNVSPQAKLVGVPRLDAEKSTNLTIGIGAKPGENFNFTIDYYNIKVKNRIVLGNNIGPSGNPDARLDQVLASNNIVGLSFFANALDTRTAGIDFVASYKNIAVGNGTLRLNLAGNYTLENKREGRVKNPAIIAEAGQTVLNATQEALMFTSRPKYKAILGADYTLGKFNFTLTNTAFGPTKFRNAGMNNNLQIEFLTKVVTDLGISYQFDDAVSVTFNANNIFNVLPEWKFVALNAEGNAILNDPAAIKVQSNLVTFNQRYSRMTYDGYHFSQLGSMFNLALNVKI